MRTEITKAQRIVVKIGSSSLSDMQTEDIDFNKINQLAKILTRLRKAGKEIVLVSSGAQAVGKQVLALSEIPQSMGKKQALAAIGQAKLMMTYLNYFSGYNQNIAQILMTKETMSKERTRNNARNTFNELLAMGIIPIVNENDSVATYEIEFGDNDHLSSFVVSLIEADLLILLSDIDGLYTDDPSINQDAQFIPYVEKVEAIHFEMGKESSSSTIGTGGMRAKIDAARIANASGAAMVLMSGKDVSKIEHVLKGEVIGTYFKANKLEAFDIKDFM